jgi:hypothetical protein
MLLESSAFRPVRMSKRVAFMVIFSEIMGCFEQFLLPYGRYKE